MTFYRHSTENEETTVEPEDRPFKCLEELRFLFDHAAIAHVQNWLTEHSEKQVRLIM